MSFITTNMKKWSNVINVRHADAMITSKWWNIIIYHNLMKIINFIILCPKMTKKGVKKSGKNPHFCTCKNPIKPPPLACAKWGGLGNRFLWCIILSKMTIFWHFLMKMTNFDYLQCMRFNEHFHILAMCKTL